GGWWRRSARSARGRAAAGGKAVTCAYVSAADLRVIARAEAGEEEPVVLEPVAEGPPRGRQRIGQMALDMRPRSTCRRLTKAIPVPGMTEAWHDDLDAVHRYPKCGHPCLERRDTGVLGHKSRERSCPYGADRVGAGPRARCRHLWLVLDLGVEEGEAPAPVVVHGVFAVLAARVQPHPPGRFQAGPTVRQIPGAGRAVRQQMTADAPPAERGEKTEVDD